MTTSALPHVAVATFCERVLQERDGVYSIIRIIDTMTLDVVERDLPGLGVIPLTAFIVLKSDESRGRHVVTVAGHGPSGPPASLVTEPVHFDLGGEEQGVAIMAQIGVRPNRFGLYWFDVNVDGQRVTRIPLRLQGQVDSVPTSS